MLLLICGLIIPIIIMLMGGMLIIFPPKSINWFYGYRTKKAMLNKQTWEYSQKYSAQTSLFIGASLLILSIIVSIIYFNQVLQKQFNILLILMVVQTLSLSLIIIITEKALNKYFDETGNRQDNKNRK